MSIKEQRNRQPFSAQCVLVVSICHIRMSFSSEYCCYCAFSASFWPVKVGGFYRLLVDSGELLIESAVDHYGAVP